MDAGDQFSDPSVVAAYEHRPPIPTLLLDQALRLLGENPRSLLDAGCGTGPVARALAPHVDRVDAIDPSAAMLAVGQKVSRQTNIRWIEATLEDATLDGPYGLVACAGSLHWMDHDIVLPKFHAALAPAAFLALIVQWEVASEWTEPLREIKMRYSTNQDEHRYNLIGSLTSKNLFEVAGSVTTDPEKYTQSLTSYIESVHSRSGWSRDRMSGHSASAMDSAVADLLEPHTVDGNIELQIQGRIIWGRPYRPSPE